MDRREFLRRLTAGAVAISIPAVPRAVAVPTGLQRLPACGLEIYSALLRPSLAGDRQWLELPRLEEPATGSLLARLRLVPVEATRDRVQLEAEAPVTALASGTPDYFRLICQGRPLFQADAGVGWGSLRFNSSFIAGGTVRINHFEISQS